MNRSSIEKVNSEINTSFSSVAFISDVHLGMFDEEKNRELENAFLSLIDVLEVQVDALVIGGDLFDYWMQHGKNIPNLGKASLAKLGELADRKPIFFLDGNHDCWDINTFENLGFYHHKNWIDLRLGRRKTLVIHGDGLPDSTMRLSRPPLHRLLRNATFLTFYRNIFPKKWAWAVMRTFSSFTRLLDVVRDTKSKKINFWAGRFLAESDVDIVVAGHQHYAEFEVLEGGLYINTGNFFADRTFGIFTDDSFSLCKWNDSTLTIEKLKSE